MRAATIVLKHVHLQPALLPFNDNESFHSNGQNCVDRPSKGNVGKRKTCWKEMRKELVTIGLAENGEGEDDKGEDQTEAVKNAQAEDEADKATFETKIGFAENTDG